MVDGMTFLRHEGAAKHRLCSMHYVLMRTARANNHILVTYKRLADSRARKRADASTPSILRVLDKR